MKSTHALLACSLLSVTSIFVSCGGDDGKKKVSAADGGTGGGGGEPAVSSGGSDFTPPEGGRGGEPVTPPEGGMGGAPLIASGGQGGEGPPPLCFDQGTPGAAGVAGAAGAGGVGSPPFTFRCEDLNLGYFVDTKQVTLSLRQGKAGLLPATGGHFKFTYDYFVDPNTASGCQDGVALTSKDGSLELPIDPAEMVQSQVLIGSLVLSDDCGGEVTMDTSGSFDGTCHIPRLYQSGQTWFVDCYEGFGTDCDPVCAPPAL
jgi:hypothetical protein